MVKQSATGSVDRFLDFVMTSVSIQIMRWLEKKKSLAHFAVLLLAEIC